MFDYRAGPPPEEFNPKHMLYRRNGADLKDCAVYSGAMLGLLLAVSVILAVTVGG